MTEARTLQPGPGHKTPAWRGGAFLLGFAFLLIIFDWVLGSFIQLGIGRFLIAFVCGGIALSAPYGLGLGKKAAASRPPPPSRDWVPQAHVQGEAGATYVIVAPPEAPAAPAPAALGPRSKVRDLTPGWWALYTLFWRWPVLMGDYGLTGLWLLIQRVRGTRNERPLRNLDFDDPTSLPQPDRETF